MFAPGRAQADVSERWSSAETSPSGADRAIGAPMDAIRVRGGKRLHGTIPISGAKNAALPILCATLLSDGESLLRNVPKLRDIDTSAALLRFLGRGVSVDAPLVRVAAGCDVRPEAPYELVKQMRA